MTVYVRACPDPNGGWYLWADTPDEALMAAAHAGANVLAAHRPARAEGHYDLTPEQWAIAMANGAEVRPLVSAWINAAQRLNRAGLLAKTHLDSLGAHP